MSHPLVWHHRYRTIPSDVGCSDIGRQDSEERPHAGHHHGSHCASESRAMSASVRSWVKYIQPLHDRRAACAGRHVLPACRTGHATDAAGRVCRTASGVSAAASGAQALHRPGRVHFDVVRGALQQLMAEVRHRP